MKHITPHQEMKIFKKIFGLLSSDASLPEDFSEERYQTAYPDCNGNPQKHFREIGYKQKRICYTKGDMGRKKDIATQLEPLVSIVVTSYNYEKYIATTLDSLVNQTYKNIEVIVVDDDSHDSSVDIIKRYEAKHDFIHLITHPDGKNHGLPASMMLGIENARGEYVAFCESDDYIKDCYIQEKVNMVNTYDNVVIISNAIKMFGNEKDIEARGWVCDHIRKLLKQGGTPIDLRYNQEFNFIPTLSSVMIRTDVLKSLNYDTPVPAWIDFWLYRQILIKYPLYFVDKDMTFWRQHNSFNGLENSSKIVSKLQDFLEKSNTLIGLHKNY